MSMTLALPVLLAVAQACAPQVAPTTLLSVARAESGFDPLVIGVNGRPHRALHPASLDEAIRQARRLIAEGADIDLGLTQINVRNLPHAGLTVTSAFQPCANLRAGGDILTAGFRVAVATSSSPQSALDAALSRYNTGDSSRGLRNGYVAEVHRAAAHVVPAIAAASQARDPADETAPAKLEAQPTMGVAPFAPLDIFARRSSTLVAWSGDPAPLLPSPMPNNPGARP